ncbi:LysR family transcriptional regulator [Ruegeria lacuscaerulensis]|uniref:LysR family transcriptional regulator n=1 Tax=Ruegeria lacuscaerulensis TaxID=55218 RepID=UPI00147BE912|nr:LysR family transcriptional regulator [Ruegeria lacuscaerulensis]
MPDLNVLKSFVLAADTLNFSEAAERRNTVQSAVSAHITKLETELQRPLFLRGRGQPMSLTPEGEAFLVYARRILTLSDEAVETIRSARSRRIVRLGTTVTLAMSVVTDVLSAFAAERPDVQLHIQCDRSDTLLNRLDVDDIDIAFMMDQGKRPERNFVHSQPLAWVASPEFSIAKGADVPLAFLTDGRDLRRYTFEALDAVGRRGFIAHLSPHPIGVRAFVQAGLAVTVMPVSTVNQPLRILPTERCLPPLAPVALSAYRSANRNNKDINLLSDLLERSISKDAAKN